MKEKFIITEVSYSAANLSNVLLLFTPNKEQYDFYPEAVEAIKSLPSGNYQIQKIFVVE